jgi:class 3 adenylate cyclase
MTNAHTTTKDHDDNGGGKSQQAKPTVEQTSSKETAYLNQDLDQLKSDLSEALNRQVATNDILHLISRSPSDTQPVFDAIVRSASNLFPGAAISVALPRGGVVDAVAVAHDDPVRAKAWSERFPFPLTREYMHGVALLDGQIVDIPDVAHSPNKDSAGAKNFLATGYRAVTMMPMLLDGKAIGVLGIVRLAPGPLSEQQLAVLRTFAAQAVIAIENTRLVNEMRHTNGVLAAVSDQLAKYISPQLYASIVKGDQRVVIGSNRKKLTILFSDIASFTEITDQLESEELTSLLNQYLTEMSRIAHEHGATFDKFIGDAMMFYFGDPETKGVNEDASACVRMAIAMQNRLRKLQTGWQDQGLIDRPFEARIGINTGYCTVGNFGSEERMNYTIIGGEVNLAARLESSADVGGVLLAAETYSLVKDWVLVEEQEEIEVKGFPKPIRTFSVKGIYDRPAKQEPLYCYEDEGVTISLDNDRTDKAKAEEALKRALAHLRT